MIIEFIMKKLIFALICMLAVLPATARDWKTETGYRGNAETGFVFGGGDYGQTEWILQTTHGYQVIPTYLFIGAGAGIGVPTGDQLKISSMVFGDIRTHFTSSQFSPFVDVKIGFQWNRNKKGLKSGYNIQDGFYFSPSVGVNYSFNKNLGLDLSVGYTLAEAPIYHGSKSDKSTPREMKNIGGFTFRVGVNF